ncbi:MAG: DUF4221 domain-containing protein [Flavobacteriaceae bacterium]|nr:DUF4221 domain-containing protein [Flavobacteriaceae bacterium]
MKNSVYLIILSVLILACSEKKNSISDFNNQIDTLTISHPNSKYQNLYTITAFDKKSNKFYGLNSTLNSIDVFSLNGKNPPRQIHIKNEGPNQIEEMISGMAINDGNLIVVGFNYIYKLNNDGEVLNRIAINANTENTLLQTQPIYDIEDNVIEIVNEDQFILKTVNYKDSRTHQTKDFYKNYSHLVSFTPSTHQFQNLNIKYPKSYSENFYGFNTRFSMALHQKSNQLFYSFEGTPSLFYLDLEARKAKPKEIKLDTKNLSKFKITTKSYQSNNAFDLKNYLVNSNFDGIASTEDYIVLMHHSSQNMDEIDPEMNTKNKVRELIVYDVEERKFIGKIIINGKILSKSHFSVGNDLYLQYLNEEKAENELSFLKISLDQ